MYTCQLLVLISPRNFPPMSLIFKISIVQASIGRQSLLPDDPCIPTFSQQFLSQHQSAETQCWD